jgi:F-type H+-transporting ATPase subunit epsilon
MQLDIITPDRKLLSVKAQSVSLPGVDGDMEVFDSHAPVLTLLKTGVLEFKRPDDAAPEDGKEGTWSGDGDSLRIMVSGGFAEVDNQHVTILTEHAALPEEVDAPELRKVLQDLERQQRESSTNAHNYNMISAEIERVTTKIEIAH